MSRDLHVAHAPGAADARGFTLIEVATVCAILGVLVALAFPRVQRFAEQQQTKSSATQIAGLLSEARSRAVAEATPHLVYINPKTVDASGRCGPAAELVRDSDRSYSITAGDEVREIELEPGACEKVEPFGNGTGSGSAATADVPLPQDDLALRGLGLAAMAVDPLLDPNGSSGQGSGGSSGSGSSGSSGSGSGTAMAVEPRSEMVADAVVNGATFPIDVQSGRPVIAFSERGIPVDPETPATWGSGAGAVYLTNRYSVVYAAVVQPMGGVKLRVFDRAKGDWR